MNVVNPATGKRIKTYENEDIDDAKDALATATVAFESWQVRPLRERELLLANVAEILGENTQKYAELMTREMGKPIEQAIAEIEKCEWVCNHYAEHADAYLEDEYHPSPAGSAVKTSYEPLGIVLAVMPWNFPFWQVFRFAAPYLTAGNVGILKHASNVPGCAQVIEEIFLEAGYPEGIFQSLLLPSSSIDELIADDRVKAATLTGSGPAGRAIASTTGEHLKKTVLELGGSDPFVVLPDADLDAAAATGAWARNQNGGQSCIAAKRFIVHEEIYDDFLDRLVDEFESLTIGDPTNENTDIGPQARRDLMEELHQQVTESIDAGAMLLSGGKPLDRDGVFYPPTILSDIPEGCPADTDELFGPVASVYRARSEDDAIEKANDTEFGLGASIWTEDRERGTRLAHRIDAGCVYVNQLVKSDPRVPFGGINNSGYGRELSKIGIQEFVNKKTVWVE